MKEYFFYIFLIFSIFIANFFLKKNNLLTNYTGQNHQLYTVKEKVPLSGGLFLMIYFLFQHYSFDKYLIIFLMFFFIIGLMADLNIIQSPLKRFLIQSIVIFFFIITMDLYIADIRIDFINNLLQIKFFNILFIFLCLSVLLNGTNFIDGNNGIVLGYYSIVLASIIIFILNNSIDYEFKMLISFLYFMIVLLFFNMFNKIYLGDSGVYIIVIFFSFLLIDFYLKNPISPYFIVNLLWYPAFETLFSIIRKMKYNFSPMRPDVFHFHQLIFSFLKSIFKKSKFANTLTGLVINTYNFIILIFSTYFASNSTIQIYLIITNVVIYITIYLHLRKKLLIAK